MDLVVALLSMVVGVPACLVTTLVFGRLWAWARQKGYRGPAVPAVMMAVGMIVLAGGVTGLLAAIVRWQPPDLMMMPLVMADLLGSALIALLLASLVVLALPPRHHRPDGARRVRVPFRFLGRLALVATPAIPLGLLVFDFLTVHTLTASTVVRPALVTLAVAFGCFAAANREDKPERDAKLPEDPRQPALYVRGFAEEVRMFGYRPGGPQDVTAGEIMDSMYPAERMFATFEEFLEPAVRTELGPWHGLGNPTDYLPPRGITRIYWDDHGWKQKFQELVTGSGCIIASPGTWPYLAWELAVIRDLKAHRRLFVLTPPPAGTRARRHLNLVNWYLGAKVTSWDEFARAAAKLDPEAPRTEPYEFGEDPGPGAVVTFDASARAVVLKRGARTPADYINPIRDHLVSRKPSA